MKNLYLILIVVCLCFSVNGLFAQNESYPKNHFDEVFTPDYNYKVGTIIYKADAKVLSDQWQSESFKIVDDFFSTGTYESNKEYIAISPIIELPQILKGENLLLNIKDKFCTETEYDFICVDISTDFGKTWKRLYRSSGKTDLRDNYLNINKFAGNEIILSVSLTTDESIESEGWSISSLNIFSTLEQTKGSAEATQVTELEILQIHTDNYPDAVFIDFYAKDRFGNSVEGLEITDISGTDYFEDISTCTKLVQGASGGKQSVDMIFLMDNSGSMYDEQANVYDNIESMVTYLEDNYNIRFALIRYGYSGSTDQPILEINPNSADNSPFFYDVNQFKSMWRTKNHLNGSIEPAYWAIYEAATNPLIQFRDKADKIVVLITDESVSNGVAGSNVCHISKTQATSACQNKGIRFFTVTKDLNIFRQDFESICTSTGGAFYPYIDGHFENFYGSIVSSVESKYTLRYCPTTIYIPNGPTPCVPVEIYLTDNPGVNDEGCYVPTPEPKLVRTYQTRLLDNSVQSENESKTVSIEVFDGNPIGVKLYYRNIGANDPLTKPFLGGDFMQRNGNIFTGQIPSDLVLRYNVDYYFEAIFPNNKVVKSPVENELYFAWGFAVNPNYPPSITNVVAPTSANPCSPIEIKATIYDNTENLTKTALFYKPNLSISGWVKVDMQPTNISNQYSAVIPAEAVDNYGLSYYIYAEDNYGTQGTYGTSDAPKTIQANQITLSNYGAMYIGVFNVDDISVGCSALGFNDVIKAYFINDCGQQQEAGTGVKLPGNVHYEMYVYGDDPATPNIKDGFILGERIVFKLIRDGRDYDLNLTMDGGQTIGYLDYAPGARLVRAMSGSSKPGIIVKGNGVEIEHNDITPALNDHTYFGTRNSPTYKTFVIKNNGCAPLIIEEIRLTDGTNNFTVSNLSSTNIPINGEATFDVTFNAYHTGQSTIQIINNSPIRHYNFDVRATYGEGFTVDVFPNPTYPSQGATISFNVEHLRVSTNIQVYDFWGQFVGFVLTPTVLWQGEHQYFINGLNSGTYYIVVNMGPDSVTKPLIVE